MQRLQKVFVGTTKIVVLVVILGIVIGLRTPARHVSAESGTVPITAQVLSSPPTIPATIQQPIGGQHFSTTPLVVKGTCQPGLLVRIFDNNILAGSINCDPTGHFTMNITLQMGKNVLTGNNFDIFEQSGPASAAVTVFVDAPLIPQKLLETPATRQRNGDSPEPLFQHTIFEPLGYILGLGAHTSTVSINDRINTAGQGAFVFASIFIADKALFDSTLKNKTRSLFKRLFWKA